MRTPEELKAGVLAAYEQLGHTLRDLFTEAPPAEPPPLVVGPTDDLAAALLTGRAVHLVAGETYPGVTLPSGANIVGNGALIHGAGRPALYVAPGTSNVSVDGVACTSDVSSVVQLGDSSSLTQGAPDRVPYGIALSRVVVPIHRGKRAFEVHAIGMMVDCEAYDVYAPTVVDSQGLWIHNTPGPFSVVGGRFEAGSENIMVGGDTAKIPGNVPSDLLFDGVTLHKPESWRTDGVNRAVKNLFELKAGRRVSVRNCTMSGSWVASQTGYAIVITPKNGHHIEDVVFDNVTVERCASGVQLMGLDYNSVTPQATRGIVFSNSRFTISKAQYGGSKGHLALYVGGMLDSTWENVTAAFDGQMIVEVDSQTPTGPFHMVNSVMPSGAYGVKAPGANYGNMGYAGREFAALLEGNTFDLSAMSTAGRTQFRGNFPNNSFAP